MMMMLGDDLEDEEEAKGFQKDSIIVADRFII